MRRGGLTAHYRFGARSAGATLITGLGFVVAALVFAGRAGHALSLAPNALLGAMVLYVGFRHVSLIRGLNSGRWTAWLMGLAGVETGNLAFSLALGLVAENGKLIWRQGWVRRPEGGGPCSPAALPSSHSG